MRFLAKKCENIAKSRQKMIPEICVYTICSVENFWVNMIPGQHDKSASRMVTITDPEQTAC